MYFFQTKPILNENKEDFTYCRRYAKAIEQLIEQRKNILLMVTK